ncbi:hypothetical protein DO97_10650 [Neosynechococcus sphagnicola sy1]|uniref:Uncharacterized protein n=1 Tax=Neosynechococcus sphagnicola sy1 TaxID=1497020 RepID=A0A098TNG9_9CYAN|nr:hypothetical protein [Neosynechococcus sphagnicola]KGF73839.1 hypothetical protein DO97_10650 [Neosynechococcus sphagnicola sy1]
MIFSLEVAKRALVDACYDRDAYYGRVLLRNLPTQALGTLLAELPAVSEWLADLLTEVEFIEKGLEIYRWKIRALPQSEREYLCRMLFQRVPSTPEAQVFALLELLD